MTTAPTTQGFGELGLSAVMLSALEKAEYLQPTPVQAGVIPRALEGIDLMGQARTGTGKTAAFVIPILERLKPRRETHSHSPQALILVPTRELAVQVRGEVEKLSIGRRVHTVALYGGKPLKGQIDKLRRGADVIVGTPGRVLDLLGRGSLALDQLQVVVLDEADRMLDIGFRPDIEKILRRCPQSRQTLLLSATVPPPVARLAERYMRDPESLDFSPTDISVETIEQFYFTVASGHKFELLLKLLKKENPRQAIVFCRTKRGTEKVGRALARHLNDADCIHGDLQQSARDRVMAKFREGKVRFLVATDVVGRGIDVTSISHIINYDVPAFCDDYVHRVGRTGRMGREGVAFTFVTPEEGNELTRIEIRINRLLHRAELEGFSHAERIAVASNGGGGGGGSRAEASNDAPAGEPKRPPAVGRDGRPRRRIRRAL